MKTLLVVALSLGVLAGCRESTEPVEPTVVGTYRLRAVDGNLLPHSILIDNEQTTVDDGELELTAARTLTLSLTLGTPDFPVGQALALAGSYRMVTADSVVFPAIAAPEFFIKRRGPALVLVSQSSGSGTGPARFIGGSHEFTFLVEDATEVSP